MNLLILRLQNVYEKDQPIFFEEIEEVMKGYSRQRIYQLIKKAENEKELVRFSQGVYFMLEETMFGPSVCSVEAVVDKKYVEDKGEVFGIYGKNYLLNYFYFSQQVPNTFEIITNNESKNFKMQKIRKMKVVTRKSKTKITKENSNEYILMELYRYITLKQIEMNQDAKNEIFKFVKEKNIKKETLVELNSFFPKKCLENIVKSGAYYEAI